MDLRVWCVVFLVYVPWVRATWSPSLSATWKLMDPDNGNKTCLLLSGKFYFNVPYLREDGQVATARIKVPVFAHEDGMCTKWLQEISLQWSPPDTGGATNEVAFVFSQNGTRTNSVLTGYFQLVEIRATLHTNPSDFPQSKNPGKTYSFFVTELTGWSAPLELSYYCDSTEMFLLDNTNPSNPASLMTSHVQVQPFRMKSMEGNPTVFSNRSYCGQDVQNMMTQGLLFIFFLFLVSVVLAMFLERRKKAAYHPL